MHSVNKRVQKFVVADIGTSQKAPPTPSNWHCSRCRLDCQHLRDRRHCLFQGIPHLHNLQISYIISKRREAMTTQKSFSRPREDGKHTASAMPAQGVVFRPLFFEYKLLIPYAHPFFWTSRPVICIVVDLVLCMCRYS